MGLRRSVSLATPDQGASPIASITTSSTDPVRILRNVTLNPHPSTAADSKIKITCTQTNLCLAET
jgi:hypothetical protein